MVWRPPPGQSPINGNYAATGEPPMLRTALLAVGVAAALVAQPARADTGSLTINVTNLESQGAVLVQVFASEAAYRGGEAVAVGMAPISADTASVEIPNLAPGQYAFRMFHDVNGDGEMNTNPFGIPTEPFAFSNNARGSFGPASWADAAFTLNIGANVQQIALGGR